MLPPLRFVASSSSLCRPCHLRRGAPGARAPKSERLPEHAPPLPRRPVEVAPAEVRPLRLGPLREPPLGDDDDVRAVEAPGAVGVARVVEHGGGGEESPHRRRRGVTCGTWLLLVVVVAPSTAACGAAIAIAFIAGTRAVTTTVADATTVLKAIAVNADCIRT